MLFIYCLHFVYALFNCRYQPICEKKDELPVFDKNDDNYKKHRKSEIEYDNCKLMWYTNYGPSEINTGNLGLEAFNGFVSQYVYNSIFYIYIYIYYFL